MYWIRLRLDEERNAVFNQSADLATYPRKAAELMRNLGSPRFLPWVFSVLVLSLGPPLALAQVNPFPGDSIPQADGTQKIPGWSNAQVFANDFDQSVTYPAAKDLVNPEQDFVNRAVAVLSYNACGRELDYAGIRAEMAIPNNPDYSHEGAELTSTLIAKIAWFNDPRTAGTPCTANLKFHLLGGRGDATAIRGFFNNYINLIDLPGCDQFNFDGSVPDPFVVTVTVTPACMQIQVNKSVRAMHKTGQLGSTAPCFDPLPATVTGEWDQNNRNLVRILYMGQMTRRDSQGRTSNPMLTADTLNYMFDPSSGPLMAAQGAVGPDYYNIISTCTNLAGDATSSPQDLGDQDNFLHKVENDLGDLFKWFFDISIKNFVGDALATVAPELYYLPFLIDPGEDPWGAVVPTLEVDLPETENHRLQIETSRFLTNAALIADPALNNDSRNILLQDQTNVEKWLLQHLSSITANDFDEYNARPYTEYSLDSLVNLFDFTPVDDSQAAHTGLRDAAHIVLDLSDAKFIAASNAGRRMSPFRRRQEHDGYQAGSDTDCHEGPSQLFNAVCGADYEVSRALQLSGQVQLVPQLQLTAHCLPPNTTLDSRCLGSAMPGLVYAAVSSYRLPNFLLDLAINRTAYSQHIKHAGVESYYQSPSFTASVGGLQTGATAAGQIMGVSPCGLPGLSQSNCGVAMPTLIMPTVEGTTVNDVFAFQGVGVGSSRSENLCLYQGFICGINPNIGPGNPPWVLPFFSPSCITTTGISTEANVQIATLSFVDSQTCGHSTPPPYFFLAAKIGDCDGSFCDKGQKYGFMEAVEASGSFEEFMALRQAAMSASTTDKNGTATYTNASGQEIEFSLKQSEPKILSVNGGAPPASATDGGIITSDGAGHVTIHSPISTNEIKIDFSNWQLPLWTSNY